jgi:hypothetical protein
LSPPTTRRREFHQVFPGGTYERHQTTILGDGSEKPFGTPALISRGVVVPKGSQVTVSEGHPFRSRSAGEKGDLGGNFFTQKKHIETVSRDVQVLKEEVSFPIKTYHRFIGSAYAMDPKNLLFPPSLESSDSALESIGATAIARCKPTNSVANASTALGEVLKDGLPHLVGHQTWKHRNQQARNAGSEYLNIEFGWKPLVADVRSFGHAVQNAQTVLNQFNRDAGRQVRRQYTFPIQETKTESIADIPRAAFTDPSFSQMYGGSLEPCYVTRVKWQRQWFSGAFEYSLPKGTSPLSKLYRNYLDAQKLLGITLTPDTLWNLAPWSWAVDWFSNIGDVISNVSDWGVYGLVLRYGYIMEHTIVSDTYTRGSTGLQSVSGPASAVSLVTETKKRRGANPFGFGVTWDALNAAQYAILGALGLSRH